MTERKSRLSQAAATSLLQGAVDVRLGTVLRWVALAAIPIIPVMVELADWPKWVDPPLLPAFHIIYWWALLVLGVGLWEIGAKGKKRVEWLVYWQERARNLAGNIEEIGENLLGSRVGGGKPASPDRIVAGILQQIVDVVEDLTQPEPGVQITACTLTPVAQGKGAELSVVGLQATTYNKNLSRNKSYLPLEWPGPATEAYRFGTTRVVADTLAEPYREQFAGRPYRAVMAFPATIGGRILAVVTVDATQAHHFTDEVRIEKGIDAAIFPFLKLVALARIAEQRGGRRGTR